MADASALVEYRDADLLQQLQSVLSAPIAWEAEGLLQEVANMKRELGQSRLRIEKLSAEKESMSLEIERLTEMLENLAAKYGQHIALIAKKPRKAQPGGSSSLEEKVGELLVQKVIHVPVEKTVEVPVPQVVEKIVHVPQVVEKVVHVPHVVEKVVQVPQIVEREVPVPQIVEKVVEVPREVRVEVPRVQYVERTVEVPKVLQHLQEVSAEAPFIQSGVHDALVETSQAQSILQDAISEAPRSAGGRTTELPNLRAQTLEDAVALPEASGDNHWRTCDSPPDWRAVPHAQIHDSGRLPRMTSGFDAALAAAREEIRAQSALLEAEQAHRLAAYTNMSATRQLDFAPCGVSMRGSGSGRPSSASSARRRQHQSPAAAPASNKFRPVLSARTRR